MSDGCNIWGDDLTDVQLKMVIESGEDGFLGSSGHGVELRGAGQWRVARKLAELGLGTIEGGAPQGSELPGLYFNNAEAVRILHENDDLRNEGAEWDCMGCGEP